MTTKLPGWISPYEGDLNGFEKRLIKALLIALETLERSAYFNNDLNAKECLTRIHELGGNGK